MNDTKNMLKQQIEQYQKNGYVNTTEITNMYSKDVRLTRREA